MKDLQRCPRCFKLPQVTIEDKGPNAMNVILTCREHGHMAMGHTVEGAVINWNLYVMLILGKAA